MAINTTTMSIDESHTSTPAWDMLCALMARLDELLDYDDVDTRLLGRAIAATWDLAQAEEQADLATGHWNGYEPILAGENYWWQWGMPLDEDHLPILHGAPLPEEID